MRLIRVAVVATAFAQIQLHPFLNLRGETSDPSISPDGKTLVFDWWPPDEKQRGLYTRTMNGGEPRLFDNGEGDIATSPRWFENVAAKSIRSKGGLCLSNEPPSAWMSTPELRPTGNRFCSEQRRTIKIIYGRLAEFPVLISMATGLPLCRRRYGPEDHHSV